MKNKKSKTFLFRRGYYGSIEHEENSVFYGKVQGITSLIYYEGETFEEFLNAFEVIVDDYITVCHEYGHEPEVTSEEWKRENCD